MPWFILFLMSFVNRIVVSPIHVILVGLRKSFRSSLISRVTVGIFPYLIFRPYSDIVTELSIAPEKNSKLVPQHSRKELLTRGLDIDNLVPMSKDEMMARLD